MWPFRRRDIQAATITIGEPARPYEGLAPSIAAAIIAPPDGTDIITRDIALAVPAVRRGVRLICGAISSMPLIRIRDGARIEPGPLLTQPEEDRVYAKTLTETVEDLVFHPHAWWWVRARDWTGYPSRVTRLQPELVNTDPDPETGRVIRDWLYYGSERIPARDIIRFDGPDAGFLTHGAGAVITALRQELAARTYATPEIPTGILRNETEIALEDDEIADILNRWEISRRTRATAFLQGLGYDNPSATPESLQMVQSREESALQIARALCLSPRYVNTASGDSMTYSTTQWERQDLIDFTLRLFLEPIEQRLSVDDRNGSPRGQRVAFHMDAFLRGNAAERADLYVKLIPIGVMTVDEARHAEGLPVETEPAETEPETEPGTTEPDTTEPDGVPPGTGPEPAPGPERPAEQPPPNGTPAR